MSKETNSENKMGSLKISRLVWSMGLPMILSMVLQALYNVVDTVFVINMGAEGTLGNLALSAAFPVQIMMIAIGVGTGVGINAMLSEKLGEGDRRTANLVAGNGLFLIAVFYAVFFIFGAFFAKPYMRLMSNNAMVVEMGTDYLRICCCISVGSIGFAVAERFLMSTGKTVLSMLSQVTGALTNIVLDYVFIYPLQMGIAGAAYATVIGQIVSFLLAMLLHYTCNKEIDGSPRYIKPSGKILKSVYKIGFPAFLMQGMLSLMMFGVLLIIGENADEYVVHLLTGSFGIYYKLMQAALFAAFGLSNTLISIVSYNYGRKDFVRVREAVRHGVFAAVVVTACIAAIYQIFADPISRLFALTVEENALVAKSDVIASCRLALRIATLGYVFMGFTVAVQGILQGFNAVYSPLVLSALRLLVFVLPLVAWFTANAAAPKMLWWSFPIAEVLTAAFAVVFLQKALSRNIGDKASLASERGLQ